MFYVPHQLCELCQLEIVTISLKYFGGFKASKCDFNWNSVQSYWVLLKKIKLGLK